MRVLDHLVLLLVLGGLVAGSAACDTGEPGRMPPPDEAVEVTVSAPAPAGGVTMLPATVRSTDEAEVATRVAGTLRRVPVEVGTRVRAGDTLLLLDETDVAARVRSAEARAERARAYHERIRALAADGAATPQELDDARAQRGAAEGAVGEARAQLSYTTITASFDGVVTDRRADPGDLATPGVPVLAMVRMGSLKVVADIPAALAAELPVGRRLTVLDPGTGRRHAVRLVRRSPALDRGSRTARVELRFEDREGGPSATAPLPTPGAFVRLEVRETGRTSLWVPRDAVVRRGQLSGLFLVEEGAIRLRWVRLGTGDDGAVEVLAGLEEGAAVVRRPGEELADGVPVAAVRREPWTPPSAGPGSAPGTQEERGEEGAGQ